MYLVNKQIRLIRSIEDMKIDVVVGNPPYNNDIYLDFVTKAHEWTSNITCMITPAKWQAKGGKKNEQFRADIVPHMSKIVYYPCAQEIFDIRNLDGISYYLIHKNSTFKTKTIKNMSSRQKLFNNKTKRERVDPLNNAGYSNVNKIRDCSRFNLAAADWTPFGVKSEAHSKNNTVGVKVSSTPDEVCILSGDRVRGYCKRSSISKNNNLIGKWMLISNGMNGNCYYGDDGKNLGMNKTYVLKPNEIACEPYIVIGALDTEKEVESLDSYVWSKFIRFMMLTGIIGQGTADTEMWRFVPDPGAFDHIFTDEELYKKYNLTPEEINIIESVIKERK
jgi:site-specific DNA-methyltransferase (adenine-specific)